MMTIATYMIYPSSIINQNKGGIISLQETDIFEHSIWNYCKEFLNTLIENFNDHAINSVIKVCQNLLFSTS